MVELSRRTVLCGTAAAFALPGRRGEWPRPDAALVPAYFPPEVYPAQWALLADPRLFAVVFNVNSGPGEAPAPAFAAAARKIEKAGGTVVAYLDAGYGKRPVEVIHEEAARYRDWYGVADVFLDQVPSGGEWVKQFQQLTADLRAQEAECVVFNHGTCPDPGFGAIADLLVTFEGPLAAYRKLEATVWPVAAERTCHIVYGVPEADVEGVFALAERRGAGIVYVTERGGANPYDLLPAYFSRLLTL